MEEILEIFKRLKVVIEDGHFAYTSGKHGGFYIAKSRLFPHAAEVDRVGALMAWGFRDNPVDIVIGPERGGAILGRAVASHLSMWARSNKSRGEVLALVAEKSQSGFVLSPEHALFVKDKQVLVAEDVLNTGSSVLKVLELVRNLGGKVAGLTAMASHGRVNRQMLGVAQLSILKEFPERRLWEPGPKTCPMCRDRVPLDPVFGHAKKDP